MGLLSRIRAYNSVRVYNDMRRSAAVLSVGFIVGGIAGLLGVGEMRSSGQPVEGLERVIALLLFIALGVVFGVLRITVFRDRRGTR
jgi:hypothetical protein